MENYYNKSDYDHWLSIAPGLALRCRIMKSWWFFRWIEFVDFDKSLGRTLVTSREISKSSNKD